jgi:hypothetical protein
MIKQDLQLLDEVICEIKERSIEGGFKKIEFYFILCLEISRYEILTTGKITDITAESIIQLFSFQTFEIYNGIYPDLFKKCSELYERLMEYNENLKNNELSTTGVKDKSWIKYLKKSITNLILSNKPNNR